MSDDKKDLEVILSDQVKQAMTDDPELAAALKEFSALARQAHAAVEAGQYENFHNAMAALGPEPEPIDVIGDDDA